jgi:glycosyltransferase involved in cell wall biosynthesis
MQIIASHVFKGVGMIKLLIISYMFPPIAGGGTQRPLKFVKYLPQNGITPIVFCPQEAYWKTYDAKLLDLPFLKETKIYRCGIRQLQQYYHLRFKKGYKYHPYFFLLGVRYLFHLDIFSAWYFECRQRVLHIIKQEQIDCVLTTSPPHSNHLFGRFIKKIAGIPWLMDIRDAMVGDPNLPASLVSRAQAPLRFLYERSFFSSADAIISVSDPIIKSINSRHGTHKLKPKLATISNGFDEEDFNHIQRDDQPRNYLLISYTGSFMGNQTPEKFLESIRLLIASNEIDPNDLCLRFIGYYDDHIGRIFRRYNRHIPIEVLEFQPYEKALWHQMNSDLLLLIVSMAESKGGNQTMTGKFFEYIGAQRPIFALVPNGPLKDIIIGGGFGHVAPPQNTSEIGVKFLTLYRQWKNQGKLAYHPSARIRNQFTRKALTGELAAIIHKVIR